MVGFRPISDRSNLPLIDFCCHRLREVGVATNVLRSPGGDKAALYATIGPKVAGGIVLSGHTDVVPADGQPWSSDPWAVTRKNGRLVGRGTSDMLGFVSLALAAACRFSRYQLRRPIHLAFSYDEETDCSGGKILSEVMGRTLPTPELVVVGEPTQQEVVVGHKAYAELRTRVVGLPVHSSRLDLGASAVTIAARLVSYIDDLHAAYAPKSTRIDHRFNPPFTTLHCGTFRGGTSPTTVAAEAEFTTDIRTIPSENYLDFVKKIDGFADMLGRRPLVPDGPTCSIMTEVLTTIPGLTPSVSSSACDLLGSAGLSVGSATIAGGTEAGLFQAQGWSTVVCGPGDLRRAHVADEYIEIDELQSFANVLGAFADQLCTE
ncbi:acetylornithine deacetylase [Rhizobium hainanense]|uniref:acetylornithine deacetylase n=1 Tax=Rhizobium hainanense TaxID=52131 RepID=UPI002452AF88|nr:acetylornithine deacetylase [Rhizobium hainanense]